MLQLCVVGGVTNAGMFRGNSTVTQFWSGVVRTMLKRVVIFLVYLWAENAKLYTRGDIVLQEYPPPPTIAFLPHIITCACTIF